MDRSEAGRLGHAKSQETRDRQQLARVKEYENNPKRCRCCDKPIAYEQRRNVFCNHGCAASRNNQGIARNIKDKELNVCVCGKLTKNIKYCSYQCCYAHNWQEFKNDIESSGEASSARTAKRYLSSIKDACSICGRSKWLGKKLPLILDHIDGNSDNWKLTNLRLVCSNCDSLLPTYKGKNHGKGRYARRKRYKEGKSY